MSTERTLPVSKSEISERLARLRARMRQKGASWCLVRATDSYLSEYVPAHLSRRVFITGFTGSVGDAVIGLDTAFLFVDGRYALQAKEEATNFEVKVLALGVSIENACIEALRENAQGSVVLIEEDRVSKTHFDALSRAAKECNMTLIVDDGLVDEIKFGEKGLEQQIYAPVWPVDTEILGTQLGDRLASVRKDLEKSGVDAFLIVALDDIAWLSGFRGSDFSYQVTFASRALALREELWVMTPHAAAEFASESQIRHFDNFELALDKLSSLPNSKQFTIGFDPDSTPVTFVKQLKELGFFLKEMRNPVQEIKAHKCESEIKHMYSAFERADRVVLKTQNWVCDQVMSGATITEADVDNFVREQFKASGTLELSFKPICGYAKNGAVIHHSTPDNVIPIKEGELFLLDTGGIYEGGYSTDLTRTFLVGDRNTKAKDWHKQMFTLVLKGAIIGMSARMPKGFTGIQLDAMVRAPFWQLGLNFAHGTGHGIGINVHEFPPRVATVGHAKIEIGHVFSIEPGLYIPNYGGVRIENLCTVVQDDVCEGFLRVIPLTFAPIDERLIDYAMLTKAEISFLEYFKERFENPKTKWNVVPALDEQLSALMHVLQRK